MTVWGNLTEDKVTIHDTTGIYKDLISESYSDDEFDTFLDTSDELDREFMNEHKYDSDREYELEPKQSQVLHGTYSGDCVRGLPQGYGEVQYSDGGIYEGDFFAGKRHGQGRLMIADGRVYVGSFYNDIPQGRGKMTYPDGACYDGIYVGGVQHGMGVLMTTQGDCYRGQFFEGVKHGYACWETNEYTYDGQFQMGVPHGMGKWTHNQTNTVFWLESHEGICADSGIIIRPDGSEYQGEWLGGTPHGMGIERSVDGYYREGLWHNGFLSHLHYGQCHNEYGQFYEGDMMDGIPNGYGTLRSPNFYYNTEFVNGNPSPFGSGVVFYPDDTTYEGAITYHEGQIYEGFLTLDEINSMVTIGTLVNQWGDRYQGEIVRGQPDGEGVMFYNNGDIYDGEFVDGQPYGWGLLLINDDDETTYEGEVCNGVLEGVGQLWDNKGKVWDGSFSEGQLRSGLFLNEIGDLYEGEYMNGYPLGLMNISCSNGDEYFGELENMMPNGWGYMQFENGNTYEGSFLDGNMHGWGTSTYSNGHAYEGFTNQGFMSGIGRYENDMGDCCYGVFKSHYRFADDDEIENDDMTWTIVYNNGSIYRGNVCENPDFEANHKLPYVANGYGILTFPDGREYEGEFFNGSMNGWSRSIYPWGGVHVGMVEMGSQFGLGCYFSSNGDIHLGYFGDNSLFYIQYHDGRQYIGSVTHVIDGSNNLEWSMKCSPHGAGTMIFPEGHIFQGTFLDGEIHGYGVYEYDSGLVCVGNYLEGKQNGLGFMILPNGTMYFGNFLDDEAEGHGCLYDDCMVYEGEFLHGELHGQAQIDYACGASYDGHVNHGAIKGQGKLITSDGTIYNGMFHDSHFIGTATYTDGRQYTGSMTNYSAVAQQVTYIFNYQPDGQGQMMTPVTAVSQIFTSMLGDQYNAGLITTGQFDMGKPTDGEGYIALPDKTLYYGQFKNGKPHGKGKMYYENGAFRQGVWVNNVQEGNGLYKDVDGEIYEGNYINGKRHGHGYIKFQWNKNYNGSFYEGDPFDKSKYGRPYVNGAIYLGNHEHGLPQGQGEIVFPNGRVYKGFVKNGIMDGHGELIMENNGPHYVGEFRSGVLINGTWHVINSTPQTIVSTPEEVVVPTPEETIVSTPEEVVVPTPEEVVPTPEVVVQAPEVVTVATEVGVTTPEVSVTDTQSSVEWVSLN